MFLQVFTPVYADLHAVLKVVCTPVIDGREGQSIELLTSPVAPGQLGFSGFFALKNGGMRRQNLREGLVVNYSTGWMQSIHIHVHASSSQEAHTELLTSFCAGPVLLISAFQEGQRFPACRFGAKQRVR